MLTALETLTRNVAVALFMPSPPLLRRRLKSLAEAALAAADTSAGEGVEVSATGAGRGVFILSESFALLRLAMLPFTFPDLIEVYATHQPPEALHRFTTALGTFLQVSEK